MQVTRDGVLIVGDAPGGNYREKALQQILEEGPGVYVQHIAHDDWCGIWFGRKCDCDPDMRLERVAPPRQAGRRGCRSLLRWRHGVGHVQGTRAQVPGF